MVLSRRGDPEGTLRDELLLALLAGRVLVVFGAGHGDLGRVALLVQQLLERVDLIALVQGREIGRLQHVTMGSTQGATLQEPSGPGWTQVLPRNLKLAQPR